MKSNIKQAVFFGGEIQDQPFSYNCDYKYSLLATKIEKGIKDRGLSKQGFASVMGVTPSLISKWLNGKHNFTIETLFAIEEKLGIKLINVETPSFEVLTIHTSSGSYLPTLNTDNFPSTIESYRSDFRTGVAVYPGNVDSNQIRYMKAFNSEDK